MNLTQPSHQIADLLAKPCLWRSGTWEDYLALRDTPEVERIRVFFDEGWLWFEMGNEGINHASYSDLFTMIIFIWKQQHPEQAIHSLGRCQLEKTGKKACGPDLVVYLGEGAPSWEVGQRRFVNLDQNRVPNLVGEISDTTLATDLDEKKRLYASLGIPEYWVIDVLGKRVFAFQLQENGVYQACETSNALSGLAIALLTQTLERLSTEANTDAALWFSQQITESAKPVLSDLNS
jgi:Uma2 family endonuclease